MNRNGINLKSPGWVLDKVSLFWIERKFPVKTSILHFDIQPDIYQSADFIHANSGYTLHH